MAMPTPHRRAFSQIQNTITKSTASISKNVNPATDEVVSTIRETEKENADKVPLAVKNKASLIEKESQQESGKKDVDAEEDAMGLKMYEVPGENFDYLKNIDFDAPIETCPQIDCHSPVRNWRDVLPPEERVSRLGPQFWNRFLMPPVDFDIDNKENIYEELYANLTDGCDLEEIESGLGHLELQKLFHE